MRVPILPMESLSAAQLAVVVIDVQVGLFCTKPAPFEAQEVIVRINSIVQKARAAGALIIFVQHDGPPGGDWLVAHSDGWRLHPDLDRHQGDVVIRKKTGDAFYATALEQTLRSRNVGSLILMGYATDFCIDATLRNAASRDFEVWVVADAHTTNDAPTLKAKDVRAHFNFVWGDSPSSRGIRVVRAQDISIRSSVNCPAST